MKTHKIPNTPYKVRVNIKNTGSNYNVFVSLFKGEDKSPLIGTVLNENSTKNDVIQWGLTKINQLNDKNIYQHMNLTI